MIREVAARDADPTEAVGFVNCVALADAKLDCLPLLTPYERVSIIVPTPNSGGVTRRGNDLAYAIEHDD